MQVYRLEEDSNIEEDIKEEMKSSLLTDEEKPLEETQDLEDYIYGSEPDDQ